MKKHTFTIILAISLTLIAIYSIFVGVIDISISDILNGDYQKLYLIIISRLPRLLAIILTGAGLSVAGLIMQQLCANKFVSPSTGATIASAQLGLLICILIIPGASLFTKTTMAFTVAILGTWIFVYLINRIKIKDVVMVPLIGIMFGNVLGGIIDFVSYKYGLVQAMNGWLVGDFSLIIQGRYEVVYLVLPMIIIAFIFANHFNIIGMGENLSTNLGLSYNKILFAGLSIAAIITASIVVTVGSIPYIGLIIPNLVAIFKGDKMRSNMIDVALSGSLFVLICDIVGRLIIFPYEIPIQLTVGVIGSILFIILMFRRLGIKKSKKIKEKVNYESITQT